MTNDQIVIGVIARVIGQSGTVVVGSSSPVPAAAALLAQAVTGGSVRALIFRNNIRDPFPESGSELYDRIGQGRVDMFFLSGGQIDGSANLNMVGVGTYPQTKVRFPGSHGSPFIYLMVPRVILYRAEHSRRVFVPRVDFISAPGVTPAGVYRRGGPSDLITGMAHFTFDRAAGRFTLRSVHPGHTAVEVEQATGFTYEQPDEIAESPDLPADWLRLLRGEVRDQVAETYPQFASKLGLE
jgi:glutaconate CoA-transferase, subunit B